MNTFDPETLDEAIDRVAASLTAIGAGESMRARIRSRLRPEHRAMPWWAGLMAGVAAAAMLLMTLRTERAVPIPVLPSAPTAQLVSIPRAVRSSSDAGPVVDLSSRASAGATAPAGAARARAFASAPPRIAALTLPSTLAVAQLPLESLTIGAVELNHLSVPTLDVQGLDGSGDSKENR